MSPESSPRGGCAIADQTHDFSSHTLEVPVSKHPKQRKQWRKIKHLFPGKILHSSSTWRDTPRQENDSLQQEWKGKERPLSALRDGPESGRARLSSRPGLLAGPEAATPVSSLRLQDPSATNTHVHTHIDSSVIHDGQRQARPNIHPQTHQEASGYPSALTRKEMPTAAPRGCPGWRVLGGASQWWGDGCARFQAREALEPSITATGGSTVGPGLGRGWSEC